MRIVDVGICEFANCGYTNSSTNRIVKNAGISKGSLFKYFPSKEELYFYILDHVTAELISSLEKEVDTLSADLFSRVIEYSVLEFAWYIQHPDKSRLIIGAFTKNDSEIYRKTVERYGIKEQDIYYRLLEDIDTKQFRWDKQKSIDILKWFLKGFNEDFLSSVQADSDTEFARIRNEYVTNLKEHIEILKTGLMK